MIQLKDFSNDGFDRGASRFREITWLFARLFLFQLPVPLPSRVRTSTLRLFGARVGTGVVIRAGVSISFPWRVTIGDHVWIGENVSILSLAEVVIGSNCCLSQRAFFCTGSHDFGSTKFDLVTKSIVVGDGCWIAASSFVAPGVTFHEGSMCAAGSVVIKDVPSNTVVGGNPARPISTTK